MKTRKYTDFIKYIPLFALLMIAFACAEEKRFDINVDDSIPPGMPTIKKAYRALHGGARLYYNPPADEDVLSIDVEYANPNTKKTVRYSASYLTDSIDIYGLPDTVDYKLNLFAVDRAGNKSESTEITVRPLESALSQVRKSMVVKGGFDALFVTWADTLERPINVIVDYAFTLNGAQRSLRTVFSSKERENRRYITDLALEPTSPVKVQARVSDEFGNVTEPVEFGNLFVLKDVLVPKFDANKNALWKLPVSGEYAPAGSDVSQVFGSGMEGLLSRVIDGEIDERENLNFLVASPYSDPFPPNNYPPYYWNVLIDLGDYYELSRIRTHQRHTAGGDAVDNGKRANYYRSSNVGQYRMYRWDDTENRWDTLSMHRIPIPVGELAEIDWYRLGRAGDMAYMYPNDPKYTKPTRWFRYEGMANFDQNYSGGAGCLSEITLYSKKK
ncbi:MAG: DUF4959 domain-containing protein [Prevotellaceae bacterium]|jgi:hypothetical protein|nr:DUF4959 domain-containing protein [Prevotellaceae bacterium]